MGLIVANCRGCGAGFMWFTGSILRLCGKCRTLPNITREQEQQMKVEYDPSKFSDQSVIESIQSLCADLNKALKAAKDRDLRVLIQTVPDAVIQMQAQSFSGYPRDVYLDANNVLKVTSATRTKVENFL